MAVSQYLIERKIIEALEPFKIYFLPLFPWIFGKDYMLSKKHHVDFWKYNLQPSFHFKEFDAVLLPKNSSMTRDCKPI